MSAARFAPEGRTGSQPEGRTDDQPAGRNTERPAERTASSPGTGTAAPVIALSNVVALIDRFPALAGVNLTVSAGEVVQLRGGNGAGKTTLLRVCAGLTQVRSGSASVLGFNLLADRGAVRPYVGWLGHTTSGYADLTVADQLRFAGALCGASAEELAAAADRVGLEGRLMKVRLERLSAGQHRRLALGCLVAARPALWLLDEPYSALDQSGRRLLDDVLAEAAASGATVVLASHDRAEAVPSATRTVTLAGGVVFADRLAATTVSSTADLAAADAEAPETREQHRAG